MLTSDPDRLHGSPPSSSSTEQHLAILIGKVCSERAKERSDAVANLRSACASSGIPKSMATALVQAMCSRLHLEATTVGKKPSHALSKGAAGVRDCKWAVQCAIQAGNGRLPSNAVQAIVEAVGNIVDGEVLGEYVSSVCNRLLFNQHPAYAHCITQPIWERAMSSVIKGFSGVAGRRAVIHNEAELLSFVGVMMHNAPGSFVDQCRRVLAIAVDSLNNSVELPDLAIFSAAMDLVLLSLRRSKLLGCLVEVWNGCPLEEQLFISCMKQRTLMQQSSGAQVLYSILTNGLRLPTDNLRAFVIEELSSGRICSSNISANEYFSPTKTQYLELMTVLAYLVPHGQILEMVNSRFPENRAFQIIAASEKPRVDLLTLVDRLERGNRESHPFVLVCISKVISPNVTTDACDRICRACSILALRYDCREAVLHAFDRLIECCIRSIDFGSLDQLIEVLLAVAEAKDPNLRFLQLFLTYCERRFEYEYWTGLGQKMFDKLTAWLTSYPVSQIPTDLILRFRRLPFSLQGVDSPEWNSVLKCCPAESYGPVLANIVEGHGLSVGQAEAIIKILVRFIESHGNSSHSQHTLTLVDSMHYSPFNGKSDKVSALALIQKALKRNPTCSSLFISDARKYLVKKLESLDPYEFGFFVESVDTLSSIEDPCCSIAESILRCQFDPFFYHVSLRVVIKCEHFDSNTFSKLLETIIKALAAGLFSPPPDCARALLAKTSDESMAIELVHVLSIDVVAKWIRGDEMLANRLTSLASSSFSCTFIGWCASDFMRQRGQLFVELLSLRLSSGAFLDMELLLSKLSTPLLNILPAVTLRLLKNEVVIPDSIAHNPLFFSPLLAKYQAAFPHEYVQVIAPVLASVDVMKMEQITKAQRDSNSYLSFAYLMHFGVDLNSSASGFGSATSADHFLVTIRYCCLIKEMPYEVLKALDIVGDVLQSPRSFISSLAIDLTYKTALTCDLPLDFKKKVTERVLCQLENIPSIKASLLRSSLPVILLYASIFGFASSSVLAEYDVVLRICRRERIETQDKKTIDILLAMLEYGNDDLLLHIADCCRETVRFDRHAKAIYDAKPHLKPSIIWDVDNSDLDDSQLPELVYNSVNRSSNPKAFYDFSVWCFLFRKDLDLEFLLRRDDRWAEVMGKNSNPSFLTEEAMVSKNSHYGLQLPSYLAYLFDLFSNEEIQAGVLYHAFAHNLDVQEFAEKLLTVLRSISPGIAACAFVKILAFACKSAEILDRYHGQFVQLFHCWSGSLDMKSQVYCFEALRIYDGGDVKLAFVKCEEAFTSVDSYASFEKPPNCISLLLKRNMVNESSDVSLYMERFILDQECWTESKVPCQLTRYEDRRQYSLVKLQKEHISHDPFIGFACAARMRPFDSRSAQNWFEVMRNTCDYKVRLVSMFDQLGRLCNDPAAIFSSGLLACKLLRAESSMDIALQSARSLIANHKSVLKRDCPLLLAEGMSKVGKWLAEDKAAVPREILEEYLEPAFRLASSGTRTHSKVLYRLAWFLDLQYRELECSELLQAKAEIIRYSRQQIDLMRIAIPTKTSKERQALERSRALLETQLSIDQEEYNRLVRDKTGYLARLLEYYLRVLALSNDRDLVVFRLCSLWFSAKDDDLEAINERTSPILPSVPSHKFLPVMYQLASKYQVLDPSSRMFALLTSLLKRLLHKHPYHSIMQFIALSHGHVSHSGTKRQADSLEQLQPNNAKDLLNALRAAKVTSGIIKAIEQVAMAYTELAEMEVAQSAVSRSGSLFPIPKHMPITKLSNCPVPLLTKHLEPNPEGNYSFATTLQFIDPQFRVIGGINLPKIIECVGSDGHRYKQLVKGRDDLRQDAVVEQVFRLVNRMFQKHPIPSIAPLRCYRVVPLHQRAGVLEWVTEAIPIGDYLASAHERYRPDDWTPQQARHMARIEAERPGATFASKLQLFNDIQSHLRPVLHMFFMERFASIDKWCQARQSYQSSCASTSMMGHIIGLGDRHCQNILIDCQTGQLIHIDLNMIFEQGRTLRIPERVPFRLTADIRDAMGPHGVEHGFRTSSIAVMSEIRQQAEGVLMVLEVFKHDPLHHWQANLNAAASSRANFDKLSDLQSPLFNNVAATSATLSSAASRYDMADRALLRVKEKVSGREEGVQVSVAAQVQYLIQQATSAELLSQMYAGWQSWL